MSITLINLYDRVLVRLQDMSLEAVPPSVIRTYANEVQHKVIRKARPLRATATISLTASQQSDNLSSDFYAMEGAIYNTERELILRDFSYLRSLDPNWKATTGTPKFMAIDKKAKTIHWYPVPDATAGGKSVVYDYLQDSTDLSALSDSPAWDDEYHYLMIDGVIAMVYDEFFPNPELAVYYWDKFNRGVRALRSDVLFPERDAIYENEFSDMVTYR